MKKRKVKVNMRMRWLAGQMLMAIGPSHFAYQGFYKVMSKTYLGDGLTPKEIELVNEIQEELKALHKRTCELGMRLNRTTTWHPGKD